MAIWYVELATPYLDLDVTQTIIDEEGREEQITTRLDSDQGARTSLAEWRYNGRFRASADVTEQKSEQVIPEPNWTVRALWFDDNRPGDVTIGDLDADEDIAVLRYEEVGYAGQRPRGW